MYNLHLLQRRIQAGFSSLKKPVRFSTLQRSSPWDRERVCHNTSTRGYTNRSASTKFQHSFSTPPSRENPAEMGLHRRGAITYASLNYSQHSHRGNTLFSYISRPSRKTQRFGFIAFSFDVRPKDGNWHCQVFPLFLGLIFVLCLYLMFLCVGL